MPFARRDAQGQVTSLHREAAVDATEFLADDHADVRAFLGMAAEPDANERFAQLDADFVRVLEDVIDTLINRNLINITDLPAEAQAKLFSRKSFRERRSSQALRLFGDADLGPLVPNPGMPPASEQG
jgi:hypothetical protein